MKATRQADAVLVPVASGGNDELPLSGELPVRRGVPEMAMQRAIFEGFEGLFWRHFAILARGLGEFG
jgi:hypothetical protein